MRVFGARAMQYFVSGFPHPVPGWWNGQTQRIQDPLLLNYQGIAHQAMLNRNQPTSKTFNYGATCKTQRGVQVLSGFAGVTVVCRSFRYLVAQ
jgi:hypothetical protein